ncbi:MAG: hypothetical protein WC095_02795 [Candidatus Paceibacterota bacterium]
MQNRKIDWKKYIYTFFITAIIFGTAIFISNYFSQKKLAEIRSIQDTISIDILSSETQFSLLEELSCKDVTTEVLSKELGNLEEKLAYTEKDRGSTDSEVQTLKRYYSLLQIKDYLLMTKISQKCDKTPISIVYFYSNKGDCEDCEKAGYVLTKMRQDYPELRVYAFDYNLDISAVQTLISINKVENKLPALIIGEKVYYGFQTIEDLNKYLPELEELRKLKNATSTQATTTKIK